MVGPLVRALWSTTRKSISASSSSPSSYLKPFLYARAAGISRSFSVATATAAANAAAPGGALDPSRLRNVAVIAHVDHGKTTLMDRLLRQCGADIPHERALDSNQLEKERGITIASKITSISWKENELNMVDTPRHADFGGEVERVVGMVEGAILVVDAGEGPLAQTKFVLAKALRYGLQPILLLNKVDRPSVSEERCDEVESSVFDLFANLGATEEQLDFPVLYASAKEGWASSTFTKNPPDDTKNMSQLLDAIVKYVPPPTANLDEPFQMLVSMMAKDDYVGRILTGRITSGVVRISDRVHGLHSTDSGVVKIEDGKVVKLRKNRGMISYDVDCAGAGDIISLAGLKSPSIGHTVANVEVMTALPTVELDPPTISMTFGVNDSPLAGLDGSQLTGGKIGDRLLAEAETNLAINVIPGLAESYEVQGRGELQLGILLENMRRENFELSVSPPKVMYKIEKGVKLEPIEEVTIEVNEEHVGLVMEALSHRRAGVTDMGPVPGNFGRSRMTLTCPSRGLVGYRSVFSSDTRGTGFMHRAFMAYEKYRGPLGNVRKGVLITSISWKDQLACLYHTRLIIFKYRPTCMFVSHKAYYLRHGCVEFTKNFHKVANSVRPVTTSVYHSNQQLNELWKSGRVSDAQYLFDEMPEKDEFTWNTMIAGYANSGKMIEAHKLFDATQNKSSITWSSLISGYCKLGFEFESIRLFCEMQYEGYKPSQFTLGSVLRMCSINGLLSTGEQIHGYAIKTQFDANVFVVTGLIDMYAQCKQLSEAKCLFATMSYGRNHVTWTAMITGYSRNQDQLGAIECYRDMRAEGVEANQYTFPSVLTACGEILAIRFGVQVHGCIVKGGFGANVFVASALVDMYAKCGSLNDAKIALVTMDVEDVVSWNSMIVGCVRQGFKWDALLLFKKMHTKNMKIDDFTYPSVLNCFVSLHDAKASKSVHCLAMKTGFGEYILVSNALVDMYAKRGELWCAFEVFNNMEEKDVVSWTSLVTGYTHNGAHEEALKLFCKMRISGIKPDQIVTASILSSCAELTVLDFGTQVHVSFIKSGFPSSLSVDNSLVTMYTNCGCIEDANKVFASMDIKNVITWTALIIGYAKNGKSKESLVFYNEMIKNGIKPDFITFIGLLFACSHAGLVDQARQYFDSMVNVYHIKPGPDHYACMIDLLGRSGKIHEAEELLNEMVIEPDATVWKALLSACRVHGKIELAEKAANTLFELEPQDAVPYVMLSNLYSSAGKWDDAARIRRLMKSRGVNKEPGYSWMEINSKVHSFMSEDRSHEKSNEIYSQINEVMMLIREAGYVPDMNFALHNIDEEGKELGLAYHSEKLAVAFGLLELPQGTPIRIYKNLRVCGDCHTAMKFISSVYSRIIILRDSNRFHHFREGVCSCGDYW